MKGTVGAATLAVIMILGVICGIICIEKIPVGYEGVVYSMNGGIQEETLPQGWHIVSPTKKVREFTVSEEQLELTKKNKDHFTVSTSDNAGIAISFQMSYCFVPDKLVKTYQRFRGMDGEDIIKNRVQSVLKSKVSEVTGNYSMMDIYSGKRSQINKEITKYLGEEFLKSYGIDVTNASIIDVHPDEQLQKSIIDRVKALQKKQQAEAEQETAKVEAETRLIKARNEAEIKVIEAQAEADANNAISQSVTQQLIDMKTAEARLKHGWVEVNGGNVIADTRK